MSLLTEQAFRIHSLPPYRLGEIALSVREARKRGADIIDLSQFNPTIETLPGEVIERLVQAVLRPQNHRYSSSQGISRLRESFSDFYARRYGVELDPAEEVVATMGVKEGLAHLLLSVVRPTDHVLIPTPSYPIHSASVFIAGASSIGVPLFTEPGELESSNYTLSEESGAFFSRLEETVSRTWPRPRLMILNFPHNPTTAVVTESFFERLVSFSKKNELLLVHDYSYSDIVFSDYVAPSILSVSGAKDIAVELYSFSKCMGLPGWRLAFCSGNKALVGGLKKIKSYLDSGIFQPIQIAAIEALNKAEPLLDANASEYERRMSQFVSGLQNCGWEVLHPKGTVFLWARLPERVRTEGSETFVRMLLEETVVAACPGVGFDTGADEYVRFALSEPEDRLQQALVSMEPFLRRICR